VKLLINILLNALNVVPVSSYRPIVEQCVEESPSKPKTELWRIKNRETSAGGPTPSTEAVSLDRKRGPCETAGERSI